MRRSTSQWRGAELDVTPVAIALIVVLGIIAISFSPMNPENQQIAIVGLISLAGGAAGMAIPRGHYQSPEFGSTPDWTNPRNRRD